MSAWCTERKIIYLRTRINYSHRPSKFRFISVSIAVGLSDKISMWRLLALQTKPPFRIRLNWPCWSNFLSTVSKLREKNFWSKTPPRGGHTPAGGPPEGEEGLTSRTLALTIRFQRVYACWNPNLPGFKISYHVCSNRPSNTNGIRKKPECFFGPCSFSR